MKTKRGKEHLIHHGKQVLRGLNTIVMNDEGKMFCNICRRYDRSGSFSVGNMNLETRNKKLETIKGMMMMMGIFLTTILMMSWRMMIS